MKRVDIIYFEASSGHKSSAEALRFGLEKAHPNWIVRTVDLRDILRCQTRLLDFIYTNGVHFFNWCMRRERYFFFATCIRLWIVFARLNTTWRPLRFLVRWTSRFWSDSPPDVLISVTPMKHTIAYEAARCVNPNVHCITVPTDISEMTPGYWFQPAIRQIYLLGCPQLVTEARAAAVQRSEIREIGGMVIHPRFYDEDLPAREELLHSLRLDPELPTGVISFGGQGTIHVLQCAQKIAEAGLQVNLICLCGINRKLLDLVEQLDAPFPIVALGADSVPPLSAHRIAQYLRIADFMIGKPGTMTVTEALIAGTPLIFIKSRGLSIVHGANEDFVVQRGVGLMASDPSTVDAAVVTVLNDPGYRQRAMSCYHRGVFDAVREISAIANAANSSGDDSTRHNGDTCPELKVAEYELN